MGNLNGLMVIDILVNGKMIKDVDMERKFGQMGIFMMENGKMTKDQDTEFIFGAMEINMKACGGIISLLDLEK